MLAASSCALKHTFGIDTIADRETCSFSALGIATNCSLLVVYSDARDNEDASIITRSTVRESATGNEAAVAAVSYDSKENESGNSHVSSVMVPSTAVVKSLRNSSGLLGAGPEVIDLTM